MTHGYRCATCGRVHDDLPLSFAAEVPDMYANMKREERDARTIIGSDQCVIDQKWFFIRGCLEIPVINLNEVFLWGLWASIREEVYDEIADSWELQGREKSRGPYKGRLGNSLSIYPPTLNLMLRIVIQPLGARPLFFIEEDHQLKTEQAQGITSSRAQELATLLLHQ